MSPHLNLSLPKLPLNHCKCVLIFISFEQQPISSHSCVLSAPIQHHYDFVQPCKMHFCSAGAFLIVLVVCIDISSEMKFWVIVLYRFPSCQLWIHPWLLGHLVPFSWFNYVSPSASFCHSIFLSLATASNISVMCREALYHRGGWGQCVDANSKVTSPLWMHG